jgi:hypothetical protein
MKPNAKKKTNQNIIAFPTQYKPATQPQPKLTPEQTALSRLHPRYAANLVKFLNLNEKLHLRISEFAAENWNVNKGDLLIVDSTQIARDGLIVAFSKDGDVNEFFYFTDDYANHLKEYSGEICMGVVVAIVKRIETFDNLLHAEFLTEQ